MTTPSPRRALFRRALLAVASAAPLVPLAAGCAQSRYDQLRERARSVEDRLVREQRTTLAARSSGQAQGADRLSHLTTLRTALTGANIGLAAVPYALEEPMRPLAYDVLDEVYGTIEWNIPLMPGDASMRTFPTAFQNGALQFDMLRQQFQNAPRQSPTSKPGPNQ